MRPCAGCDEMIDKGKYCRDCKAEILAFKKRLEDRKQKEINEKGIDGVINYADS